MRHPKRAITRPVRTRQAKRRGRLRDEVEALSWPEGTVRVRDLMTRVPITISQDATVGAAWRLMRDRAIRHLPVLDGTGRLAGIVTDRDLRQVVLEPSIEESLGSARRALDEVTLKEVMTWGVIWVHPDTDLRRAAAIIREQRIGGLPVVDGGRVIGMLTATDLVHALVTLLAEGVLSKPERWRQEG